VYVTAITFVFILASVRRDAKPVGTGIIVQEAGMERNTAIKNVIFDIGDVLVGIRLEEFAKDLFGENTAVWKRVFDAVWASGLWEELDRGVIPEKEILQRMLDRDPEMKDEIQKAWDRAGEVAYRTNHAIPWITAVKKKGYHTYYLSNYSHRMIRSNRRALDFLPLMDGGIFSCEVKLIKPDHKIYRVLLERYHLNPAECLFIDDREENTRAAEEVGIDTLRCTGFEQVQRDARDILGLDCEIFV
jgi:FMN phosphatase YigB (HAD superfamily)